MTTSTVLVCSLATHDAGNRFFCAIGQDELPGYTFSLDLSADGTAPATHRACHTMATPDLLTTITALKNGTMGPLVPVGVNWADWGTTESDVLAFGQSISVHVQGEPQIAPATFYHSILTGLGLQAIIPQI